MTSEGTGSHVLNADDYDLADVFGRGKIFTRFNSFDVDRFLAEEDRAPAQVPLVFESRSYERVRFAHNCPQYITPRGSPVLPNILDRATRMRYLSRKPNKELVAFKLSNLSEAKEDELVEWHDTSKKDTSPVMNSLKSLLISKSTIQRKEEKRPKKRLLVKLPMYKVSVSIISYSML